MRRNDWPIFQASYTLINCFIISAHEEKSLLLEGDNERQAFVQTVIRMTRKEEGEKADRKAHSLLSGSHPFVLAGDTSSSSEMLYYSPITAIVRKAVIAGKR